MIYKTKRGNFVCVIVPMGHTHYLLEYGQDANNITGRGLISDEFYSLDDAEREMRKRARRNGWELVEGADE